MSERTLTPATPAWFHAAVDRGRSPSQAGENPKKGRAKTTHCNRP